jgi:hypothetical protein
MSDEPMRTGFSLRPIAAATFLLIAATTIHPRNATSGDQREEILWQLAGGDCDARIETHQRSATSNAAGTDVEHMRLRAGVGTHVYATRGITASALIAELAPKVWIKSDRARLQILARVALPRCPDPKTGLPTTTLIRGDLYTRVGSWQELAIRQPERLLEQQVRVLRVSIGPHVDPREAYVDLIAINVYGGPGTTNVWIGGLKIDGQAGIASQIAGHQGPVNQDRSAPESSPTFGERLAATNEPSAVALRGTILTAAGRPFFPRIIEHQGESLSQLAGLGFNTVKLAAPPSPTQLQEAARSNLWLVAPPPDRFLRDGNESARQRVLAWDLGNGLTVREQESVNSRVETMRRAGSSGEPSLFVCSADSGLIGYSRHVDILLHQRLPLGTSFALADFGKWLVHRQRLARPGTPFWATVQTQPNRSLVEQLKSLNPNGPPDVNVELEQIRQLAFLAVASGARGIVFQSRSALTADTPEARLRATALRQLNFELSLIEPWAASGDVISTVTTSDPSIGGVVLGTERSRLVIPMRLAAENQHVTGAGERTTLSMVVSDVSDSSEVYQLRPAGLRPLRHQRVAGGVRVTLDDFVSTSMVVLTQNPLVLRNLSKNLLSMRAENARLQRAIVVGEMTQASSVLQSLHRIVPSTPYETNRWEQAQASLRQYDQLLAKSDTAGADMAARRGLEALSRLRRARWEQVVGSSPLAASSPFCTSFSSLPAHFQLIQRLQTSTWGANELPGGDFEDLDNMVRSGWRHYQSSAADASADVTLSPHGPHSGKLSLRLRAEASEPGVEQESAPIWINSAPITAELGQIVRIHGWVRIDEPVRGSLDGLMIFDSMAGLELARRIHQTNGWQEFEILRVVPRSGPLTVTFALTGTGGVSLDDVSVSRAGGQRESISRR